GLALARLDVLGVGDDARVVVDQDLHPVLDVVHAVSGHLELLQVKAARMDGSPRQPGTAETKVRNDTRCPSHDAVAPRAWLATAVARSGARPHRAPRPAGAGA